MRVPNRTQRSTRLAVTGLVGGLLASLVATVPAHAAGPVVFCAQAFGHEVPAAPCDPNPDQFAPAVPDGKGYPNSYLYVMSTGTSGWNYPAKGTLFVEGNATAGSTVAITVTDGSRTLGPFFVEASPQGSPSGPRKGDFRAEVQVVDLGSHKATPEADADDVGDDELGPTQLTITMTPSQGGTTGTSKSINFTKHAATHDDVTRPQLTRTTFPPSTWERNCPLSLAINAPFYAFEAALYLLGVGPYPADDMPCAHAVISGSIAEDYPAAGDRFSEISDVRIQILKGGVSYLDVRDSVEGDQLRARGKGGILTRTSSNYASYRFVVNSHDYPPNNTAQFGLDSYYMARVTVCDAWGSVDDAAATPNNCTVLNSGNITVTPY
jgi:hypothetical protein